MADIYQKIWNADQSQNGVEAILDAEQGSRDHGYVKVNSSLHQGDNQELRVSTEVHIPDEKLETYSLCRKLFNNYALAEPMHEVDTPEKRQEVHDFVSATIDTAPMEVARRYIETGIGTRLSQERWNNTIFEMWFQRFSGGSDPALSGFEHIVVGEQERVKVQGYHLAFDFEEKTDGL